MRDPDNPLSIANYFDHPAALVVVTTRNDLEACDQALGYVDSVLRMGAAERETTVVPVASAVVLLRAALAVHALVAILGATGSLLGLH